MTIAPTVAGGLKLVPQKEKDWLVLLELASDGDGDLSKHLGSLMDEDSMWDEIVVPELEQDFFDQRLAVATAVMKAKEADEPIHIDRDSAETWYGALNQARLALEEKYKFGPKEELDPEELVDHLKRSAFYRCDFYSTIQSLLLTYVLVD